MKRKHTVLILGFIIVLGSYLLWPVSSNKYRIKVDKQLLNTKHEYLNRLETSDGNGYPNILLIMVDDLGIADLSLYGEGYPVTPNIDRIGQEGVMFNNAYVTSPVCSPSRAAILTGRYQQRFGFQFQMHDRYLRNRLEYMGFKYFINSKPWNPKWMDEVPDPESISSQGIPPSEILLPELLKTRGYSTALIGKWHLGSDSLRNPCNFGFDYQFGFYASHSLYSYEQTPGIHDQKIKADFTDPHIWSGQRNGSHAIFRNCEEVVVNNYLTDVFTDEAISFIETTRRNPFFLYLSYNASHTPLQAPESYMKKFHHINDPVKRTYYAIIQSLDDNIGRLMRKITELDLDDNTVIFFISDNGGAEYTLTTDNGKYKGGKITDFEGGLKVPFFMRWKNHIQPGAYDPMVSSMDIFHTSIGITEIELPKDRVYDGKNLLANLNKKDGNPNRYLYWQRGFSKSIRDMRWKLNVNGESEDTVLYDLVNDPYENQNVYHSHKSRARELAALHAKWAQQLDRPLWPSMIYYEFVDGDETHYFDQ